MTDQFTAEAEAFENGTTPVFKQHSAPWYEIFLNGFTGYAAKRKLIMTQTISERIQNEEKRLKPIKRAMRNEIRDQRYRRIDDTILQIRQNSEESKMNFILDTQEQVANMTQVWGQVCSDFSPVEVLLKHANEKMSNIRLTTSSSKWERFIAYQQAFEGVKMFGELSKFTKAYLAISQNHFMPMLAVLTESIDTEGKNVNWIDIQTTIFEDKMMSAIEYSKL